MNDYTLKIPKLAEDAKKQLLDGKLLLSTLIGAGGAYGFMSIANNNTAPTQEILPLTEEDCEEVTITTKEPLIVVDDKYTPQEAKEIVTAEHGMGEVYVHKGTMQISIKAEDWAKLTDDEKMPFLYSIKQVFDGTSGVVTPPTFVEETPPVEHWEEEDGKTWGVKPDNGTHIEEEGNLDEPIDADNKTGTIIMESDNLVEPLDLMKVAGGRMINSSLKMESDNLLDPSSIHVLDDNLADPVIIENQSISMTHNSLVLDEFDNLPDPSLADNIPNHHVDLSDIPEITIDPASFDF